MFDPVYIHESEMRAQRNYKLAKEEDEDSCCFCCCTI